MLTQQMQDLTDIFFGCGAQVIVFLSNYMLCVPQGGSQRNAPILREDVLMQKLNKRRNRKPKEEAVDAFAPEYGPDSWFQKNHGSAAQYKGAAAALANWKHNPNERKHTRTNRRKK